MDAVLGVIDWILGSIIWMFGAISGLIGWGVSNWIYILVFAGIAIVAYLLLRSKVA